MSAKLRKKPESTNLNQMKRKKNHRKKISGQYHQNVNCQEIWWYCNGPCRKRKPFYGYRKTFQDQPPGPHLTWWSDHQKSCGGTYYKIKQLGNNVDINETNDHSYQPEVNQMKKSTEIKISEENVSNPQECWWYCDGPCSKREPFFGYAKTFKDQPPGPNLKWWNDHQMSCGGTYHKIKLLENNVDTEEKNEDELGVAGKTMSPIYDDVIVIDEVKKPKLKDQRLDNGRVNLSKCYQTHPKCSGSKVPRSTGKKRSNVNVLKFEFSDSDSDDSVIVLT